LHCKTSMNQTNCCLLSPSSSSSSSCSSLLFLWGTIGVLTLVYDGALRVSFKLRQEVFCPL
jgi:hypothetical protein